MIEMGLPYVSGYKPLRNYQELLRRVVQERVALTPQLIRSVQAEIDKLPPPAPSVDDILSTLVEPPIPRNRPSSTISSDLLSLITRSILRFCAPPTHYKQIEISASHLSR
jgi:hypothetical protein